MVPAAASAPSRLAIDVVSPLPPVRSGIADTTLDLAPHLAAGCDLRLIRLPGQPVAGEIERRWNLVSLARAGEAGRVPLYQMGNNLYHEAVLEIALRLPGILVLHDLVLHHLLVERTLGRGDFAEYVEALACDHGWIGEAVAAPRRWGGVALASLFALPANRTLLRRQRAILVHNQWAAARLLEEDPELRVAVVPLAVPLPDAPDAGSGAWLRRRLGIPADRPLLGCFGFQTPMKRLPVAVAALAEKGLEEAHLLIAGEIAPEVDVEDEAYRAGVADRVHVTGYLPFADFQAAIAACDLCVNLRYPTAGETSASLLRILACGRAALVSDYGPLADLPERAVARVPVGVGEVETLARRAGELLRAPERRREMGLEGRRLVAREHHPARAAAAALEACREWRGAEPPGAGTLSHPAPTTVAWPRLDSRVEVDSGASHWPPGERRRLSLRLANRGRARWLPGDDPAGGVIVEVGVRGRGGGWLERRPWEPLTGSLEPGEFLDLEMAVRRPFEEGVVWLMLHPRGGLASEAHEILRWQGADG